MQITRNKLVIEEFRKKDVKPYMVLCQNVFENVYPNTVLGYPPILFSKEHFFTEEMYEYFEEIMVSRKGNNGFVARLNGFIVGGIAFREYEKYYDMQGFYVLLDMHQKGIGKLLWNEALKEIKPSKPIELGVFAHNKRTISLYKKWGFKLCSKEEWGIIHWSTWPKKYILPLAKMRRDVEK